MEAKIGTNSRVDWSKAKERQRHEFCIAIPVYKEDLTIVEELSLRRLHDTLKDKSNVYAFCPIELNLDKYREIFPELKAMEFEPENFKSIDAYSHLCMKYEFYDAFSEYKYMLIYQLDCYLVTDAIGWWCDKGYDYVGAPILVPHSDWQNFIADQNGNITRFTPVVGNGGLSLRKIETFKTLTNPNGELRKRYNITDEILKDVHYEDVYFCVELNKLYDIEMPKWEDAMHFAIDMNPDIAYDKCKMEGLPIGIHAFEKNMPFWRDKVKDFDNDELCEYCNNKHKEFVDIYYFKKEK